MIASIVLVGVIIILLIYTYRLYIMIREKRVIEKLNTYTFIYPKLNNDIIP